MKDREAPTRPAGSRWHPGAPVVVLALGVLASTTLLLWHAREMWFFGDEWAFLYRRTLWGGDGPGPLAPYNEHWSTIPLFLYRGMWHIVGLQHYPLWVLMPVVTLMVGSVAMFVLLRRAGASDWTAVSCALVLAWNGSGEDTLWAFQVGFLGSLTAGVLGCLAVEGMRLRRGTGLVLANLMALGALMCSGLGIPMVAWIALFALMLRGWRDALAVGVLPTLTFVVWYVVYGASGNPQGLPDASFSQFLTYVWVGIAHVWEVTTGVSSIGAVFFFGLAAAAFLATAPNKMHALAVSGVVTALPAYGVLAFSRANQGVEQAQSLRYVPLGLVLTLPAFAIVMELIRRRLVHRSIEGAAVAAGLTVLLVAASYASTRTFAADRGATFDGLEQRVLTGVHLAENGEPLMRSTIEAANQPPIDVVLLASRGQREHVPSVDPDDEDLWTARVQLRVAIQPTPHDLPFADYVTGEGIGGDLDLSDCADVATNVLPSGYVQLPPGRGGTQIGLRSPGTSIMVQLVHDGGVTEPVSLATAAGQTSFVGTNVPDAALRVTLTTDTFGVCNHG